MTVAAGTLAVSAAWLARPARVATAESDPAEAPADVIVLATPHEVDARATVVRVVHVGAGGVSERALGAVAHPPGAVVRADAAGERVFVVADEEGAADPDWGAALFRVDASGTTRLAGGVGHARKPLVSAGGEVYVERGLSGPPPTDADARAGRLRLDSITLDAVDPASGANHALYTDTAYCLHLAGEARGELVVYRVGPSGADLVAVDEATGASRLITTVPPFARDFSVTAAGDALVFSDRDPTDAGTWTVVRVDLATGALTTLSARRGDAPAPFALPGGDVAWSAAGRRGLRLASWSASRPPLAPLGAGFDAVQAMAPDGAWVALLHVPPGGYDESAAVDLHTSRVVRLTSGDERIDVVGFVGSRDVAR